MNNILRIVAILALFICNLPVDAKTSIKEQRKLLKRYDLVDILPIEGKFKEQPHLYWEYIRENNKNYQEALKAAQNGKAKEAQRIIGNAIAEIRSSYNPALHIDGISELLDSVKDGSGISVLFPHEAKLYCDPADYPNAFSLPDGTTCLTYGIIERLDFEYNLIMAVYAHELAHFVLQHSFCDIYFADKKRKKNKNFAAIFTAISATAGAYGDIQMASNGVDTHNSMTNTAVQMGEMAVKIAEKDAITYQMRYSREQEYEADILAYRFLEAIGIDGTCYIEMLKRIKSDLEIFSNDESTHPLTDDRIALIEFLRTNPRLDPKAPKTMDDIYYIEEY